MAKEKKFRELSDEELKQVTGGASIDCSLPENKDKFQCRDKLMSLDVVSWSKILFDSQSIAATGEIE